MKPLSSKIPSQRDPHIDNVKGILIFLVVLGHAVNPFIETNRAYKVVFDFAYAFHMPLFIFIAGMFTRPGRFSEALKKNAAELLFPFVLFHVLYELSDYIIRGELSYYTRNLQPYWITWFLWSLFLWKTVVTLFPRTPALFFGSLGIALIYNATIDDNLYFGMNRTISFLPFFVAGYLWGKPLLEWVKSTPATFSVMTLAATLLFLSVDQKFNSPVFFHSETMLQLYDTPISALTVAIAAYLFSSVVAMAVVRLTTRAPSFLTSLGQRSLYIYLWHGFVIRAMVVSGLLALMEALPAPMDVALTIAASALITLSLGLPQVTTVSTRLVGRLRAAFARALMMLMGKKVEAGNTR